MKENEMENLSEKFLRISQALVAWLILVILFPFLLIIFGSLFIWKYGVLWVVVKIFKRKFLQGFANSETIFAIDRYWESSRSSLGLIVELEAAINIDIFREEFRKKILDFTLIETSNPTQENGSLLPNPKPFAKLMQIPVAFSGYYYWQKANYFLIHEHIRQINQPTDELGLKKAVGTLMSLPFPNRRPLWEILVYSNYLGTTTVGSGTTCGSALFIRIHRSLADNQGLMNILRHMMLSEKNIKFVHIANEKSETKRRESIIQKDNVGGVYNFMFTKMTSLLFLPIKTFRFAQSIIKVPDGIAKSNSRGEWESANASWATLSEVLIRKICSSQIPNLSRGAVEMSIFLEGISSSHKCANVSEEKGVPAQEGKCQTCVLIPVPQSISAKLLSNDKSFVTVKSPCISSISSTKSTFLKSIHHQLQQGREEQSHQIFRMYLRLLCLLPRHILRYLLMSKKWGAGFFIYEHFPDLPDLDKLEREEHKLFGLYQVSQIVPLLGLQWAHTAASATTLKWQGNIVMSLIANGGILGPMTQGNPQEHAERITRGLPEELERLSDDAEDHGFVSIPIS